MIQPIIVPAATGNRFQIEISLRQNFTALMNFIHTMVFIVNRGTIATTNLLFILTCLTYARLVEYSNPSYSERVYDLVSDYEIPVWIPNFIGLLPKGNRIQLANFGYIDLNLESSESTLALTAFNLNSNNEYALTVALRDVGINYNRDRLPLKKHNFNGPEKYKPYNMQSVANLNPTAPVEQISQPVRRVLGTPVSVSPTDRFPNIGFDRWFSVTNDADRTFTFQTATNINYNSLSFAFFVFYHPILINNSQLISFQMMLSTIYNFALNQLDYGDVCRSVWEWWFITKSGKANSIATNTTQQRSTNPNRSSNPSNPSNSPTNPGSGGNPPQNPNNSSPYSNMSKSDLSDFETVLQNAVTAFKKFGNILNDPRYQDALPVNLSNSLKVDLVLLKSLIKSMNEFYLAYPTSSDNPLLARNV